MEPPAPQQQIGDGLPPLVAGTSAVDDSRQRSGPTYIRVKRKRNEQPMDSLVVVAMMPPSKRATLDTLSSAFATLSTSQTDTALGPEVQTTRRLFRLAHTSKSRKVDDAKDLLTQVEEVKRKFKSTLDVPKEEKLRQNVQYKTEQARAARIKVVERHRTQAGTILDVDVEVTQKDERPRFIPQPKPTPSAPTTRKLPSVRKHFTPNLAKAKTAEQVREEQQRKKQQQMTEEAIFTNYGPMVKSYLADLKGKEKLSDDEDDYEYDLYYFDDAADRSELEREYGVVHMEAFEEGLVPENEYEESEDEYDSEDSNDENNPNYDYPEEIADSDSDREAQDDDEFAEISSEDEDHSEMHYSKRRNEAYSQYAYDEEYDDEDASEDEGGIYQPPTMQPDFAFFQTWRLMRK